MNFLVIRHPNGWAESIQTSHIVRTEWCLAAAGHDGNLQLHLTNGQMRSIPFGFPEFQAAAELLGYKDLLAEWPKKKAAAMTAIAKAKEDRDKAKSRQLQRR